MRTLTVGKQVTCARCSNTTGDPQGEHWMLRPEPVVVAGILLGLCPACLGGNAPAAPDDEQKRGDGSCKGDYRPKAGTYFEATWGDGDGPDHRWACWDEQCAEGFLEDQPYQCGECGNSVDMDVTEYHDGKRVRR